VESELSVAALAGVMRTDTSTSAALVAGTPKREAVTSDLKEKGEIVPADRKPSASAAEICLKAGQDDVISQR